MSFEWKIQHKVLLEHVADHNYSFSQIIYVSAISRPFHKRTTRVAAVKANAQIHEYSVGTDLTDLLHCVSRVIALGIAIIDTVPKPVSGKGLTENEKTDFIAHKATADQTKMHTKLFVLSSAPTEAVSEALRTPLGMTGDITL